MKPKQLMEAVRRRLNGAWNRLHRPFAGSQRYWEERYDRGGNSGLGSYGELAAFKAEVLNNFVRENHITSVIEYGCGDGNQLRLAAYPSYIGFDVSTKAIVLCKEIFSADTTKTFKLMDDYAGETAELTLSLDVIYHLVEDPVFSGYMERLFDSAREYVIIYSSDSTDPPNRLNPHIRHRKFSEWVRAERPRWELLSHIPNEFPRQSFADFYIYQRA